MHVFKCDPRCCCGSCPSKSKSTSVPTQYGFWKHDTYPYVLGAEIIELRSDGRFKPEGYGRQWFKGLVLSGKEGQTALEHINQLRSNYHRDLKALKETYGKQLSSWIKSL